MTSNAEVAAEEETAPLGAFKYLLLAVLIGAAAGTASFAFIVADRQIQSFLWYTIPGWLEWQYPQWWYVLLVPCLGGILVAAFSLLPGKGGHSPLDGFSTAKPDPKTLPSIVLAALASLTCGVVLGPEAPLVAIGVGLAFWIGGRAKLDAKKAWPGLALMGALGAVAAIFGSPLAALFVVVEAFSLGTLLIGPSAIPRLVALLVGFVVFAAAAESGLIQFRFTMNTLPAGPAFTWPSVWWSLLIGLLCGLLAIAVRSLGGVARNVAQRSNSFVCLPIAGVLVGVCALTFGAASGYDPRAVLFSGEGQLTPLAEYSAVASLGAVVLLALLKSVAYGISLGSGFRGGPIFPALIIGATVGLAASHILPGVTPLAGFAAGMSAMCSAMLRMPLAGIVLTVLLLGSGGIDTAVVAIIASIVATAVRMLLERAAPPAIAPDADIPEGAPTN